MPRVTGDGSVPIPAEVREEWGIEPGDEVTFESADRGCVLRKVAPKTEDGEDPFEKYRGSADSDRSMPDRMWRLRGEYSRDVGGAFERDVGGGSGTGEGDAGGP